MPGIAIHQSDQLKSAISNGPPARRALSAVPTRKETLVTPSAAAASRAVRILAASGSIATTLAARGAY